ncbi:MAG: CHAP domain-containing protein, partial [Clostridia bacterium]|nr:CHAP domain-containing protein [Clostridia bacterium]
WPQEQTARLEKALQQEDFWQQWERKAAGSHPLVQAAASQLGQTGGEPYWSWYGFSQRVEWCACFVSWCGEQSGLLQQGCLPKFSSCREGMQWFLQQNRWREGGTTPQPGDLIFFDWDQDGTPNHVGIVQGVKNGQVHTIEGNSEDACRKRTYEKDDERILGYGMTKREK